ncbi:protein stum isoform X2 [Pararge aegeria]|uniref:protein stum isoform X2 n=1 Tax=Pararge aegeria TaxID=116150 RepID=UPI0019CFEA07|nr:protein stum isoform X2 [Pararge aegeria]
MALKLKYTDEHGILHIDMSPSGSPIEPDQPTDPKFDTINHRFGNYDLFGGKYDDRKYEDNAETQSLFRSRYNSFEEEFANTPYAFANRVHDEPVLDITIDSRADVSPSKDIENDRFFERSDLFGPKIDLKTSEAFSVSHLIHAQDRYFDLSTRIAKKGVVRTLADSFEVKSAPGSAKRVRSVKTSDGEAFKVLSADSVKGFRGAAAKVPAVSTSKRKRETSFAIITEPTASRPTSPHSLPVEIRPGRVSPFKGRGFREETSRHNTPKTSAANSRSNSPPRRTNSLTRFDNMAQVATLPPPGPVHRPPRDFLKENMEEIRELSELNREKNEAELEKQRREEEIALLKEMGLLDRKSNVNSRTNSRSNSPGRLNLRSRSNSPSAILHFENIPRNSSEFLNKEETISRPVAHRSRVRSLSKSQPQSNNVSPKNSKIPKRQNSVSPTRSNSRLSVDKKLNANQRYMSNSTSSIHETIRIGSQMHDKRTTQSNLQLNAAQSNVKGKPPISPSRSGPPPSNKSINPKRLSPIVGTPSKSPIEDAKPGSAKTNSKPTPAAKKTVRTTVSNPATSRLNSRQTSRTTSRDSSPEKRKPAARPTKSSSTVKPPVSTKTAPKTTISNKSETKKPVSRTNSVKNLTRVPSTKNLNDKPPLSRQVSKKDLSAKSKSTTKLNEIASKSDKGEKSLTKTKEVKKSTNVENKGKEVVTTADANFGESVETQDNGTQYDKSKNQNGDMVILTKKNIVSMTTAAITSQPLEVVATVTNQLPAVLEKAREKGMFERLSSKDSLVGKEEEKITKETVEEKEKEEKKPKAKTEKTIFAEDNVRLRPLQPPYNNPHLERVKQKIDTLLKEPEISTENILAMAKAKEAAAKNIAEKAKSSIKEAKSEMKETAVEKKDEVIKKGEEMTAEIRSEATKIVDSIITPVEEPEKLLEKAKDDTKKAIEPVVKVVSEKKKEIKTEVSERITETLVQGGPEVDVQSSNFSTPGEKMALKPSGGSASDKSHSNGGFPQSTGTTPKPPPRAHRGSKEKTPPSGSDQTPTQPKPNICVRLMGKCKTKCCPCCLKKGPERLEEDGDTSEREEEADGNEKIKFWKKMNCFKKKVPEEEVEIAAGKGTTIEFETETKRKRKLRDILCACCRRQRVADVSEPPLHAGVTPPVGSSDVVKEAGCCGKRKEAERRDSILSDQPPSTCCNNRLCRWIRGACRRQPTVAESGSRRTSLFSKNKSLSPTLPPEDTRKKLDPSLIEHTSVMRGAIPVLPTILAYFCLLCNIVIPGLGTIFSGMFCICFGIPRFGVHDGAKYRIGSFIINLLVGAGQLFTVLFCLVGWGWSIWWGYIMVKTSRKYKKLKAEAAAEEAEAPPVTNNNHTRA